jgi:hypothetical protein
MSDTVHEDDKDASIISLGGVKFTHIIWEDKSNGYMLDQSQFDKLTAILALLQSGAPQTGSRAVRRPDLNDYLGGGTGMISIKEE